MSRNSQLYTIIQLQNTQPILRQLIMGSEFSKVNALLADSSHTSEWNMRNQTGKTFFVNTFSGEEFLLKNFYASHDQVKRYKQREKYSFIQCPRIIIISDQVTDMHVLVQHAPIRIQDSLRNRKSSDVELLTQLSNILQAVERLQKKHNCFFISESMIRVDRKNKIWVWYNEDFLQNEVQFPLPNGQGQEIMISRILKTYQKYLSPRYQVAFAPTFSEVLMRIEELLDKARKHTSIMSSRVDSYHNSARHNDSKAQIKRQFIPIYEPNHLMNSQQSIFRNLECSGKTGSNFNGRDRFPSPADRAPFSKSHYQFVTLTSPSQRSMPMNPQTTQRKYPYLNEKVSMNTTFKESHVPITNLKDSKQTTQKNHVPIMFRNVRDTNNSISSYASVKFEGKPFIKIMPVQYSDSIDDSPAMKHTKPQSRVPVLDRLRQNYCQMEMNLPENQRATFHNLNPTRQKTEKSMEELELSDMNISKSNNLEVDGIVDRTIDEVSELNSPLRRQIKNDLKMLFN